MTTLTKRAEPEVDGMMINSVVFPPNALQQLARWAEKTPQALALLHKHQDFWGAYRWTDVAQRVGRLSEGLARHGMRGGSRLIVCGAFEPDLLLLVLAAHRLGAMVVTVDPYAQGAYLKLQLAAAVPTHAFVQDRKILSAWIESSHINIAAIPVYSAQTSTYDSAAGRIIPLTELTGALPVSTVAAWTDNRRSCGVLWVDEGTEWPDGLERVLTEWLQSGMALAAPEMSASATRDRHEIRPQRLLASNSRHQRLQAELQLRLPEVGGWCSRLIDFAAARPAGFLSARLLRRIDRLHGLPARQGELEGISRAITRKVSA